MVGGALACEQDAKRLALTVGPNLVDFAAEVSGRWQPLVLDFFHRRDDGRCIQVGQAVDELLHWTAARSRRVITPSASRHGETIGRSCDSVGRRDRRQSTSALSLRSLTTTDEERGDDGGAVKEESGGFTSVHLSWLPRPLHPCGAMSDLWLGHRRRSRVADRSCSCCRCDATTRAGRHEVMVVFALVAVVIAVALAWGETTLWGVVPCAIATLALLFAPITRWRRKDAGEELGDYLKAAPFDGHAMQDGLARSAAVATSPRVPIGCLGLVVGVILPLATIRPSVAATVVVGIAAIGGLPARRGSVGTGAKPRLRQDAACRCRLPDPGLYRMVSEDPSPTKNSEFLFRRALGGMTDDHHHRLHQQGRLRLSCGRPRVGRLRPQRDPTGRARDARPHGVAGRVRRRAAARRRSHRRIAAHDDPDCRAHRDAHRARRRRALGVLQHLLDPGPRRRGDRRRARRHRRRPEGCAGVRLEGRDARGVLVVHRAGALRMAGRRPQHDPRRRRRRDPRRAQGRRVRARRARCPSRPRTTPKSGPSCCSCSRAR